MRDVLGWRRKFGVLGPSTNTIVQPDFEMMRPLGVTNHYSRIFTPNAQAVSNDSFMAGTQVIGRNVLDAVRSVMTCSPDYLVMGMSAITFYGGAAGADEFQRSIERESRVGVSIGSHSCTAALKAYAGVKRLAFLSPYYPVANNEVRQYFTDSGFEVVRDVYLACPICRHGVEIGPGHRSAVDAMVYATRMVRTGQLAPAAYHAQVDRFLAQMGLSASPAAVAETAPAAPPDESVTERIANLAKLKARGVLTEEEFTAAKRRLLGLDPD